MPLPCWRMAESGCGRERLQSSAVRTGGLTSVSCVFAVLDGAWQRVSRLTVVPRGLHLRYLRADRFDTASTTRGISTTLLRVSGADERRYARYGRASTTDTADTHSEHMVSRCIKTAPEVIGQNVYPVAGHSEMPWHLGHRGVFIPPIWHIRAARMPCTATGPR